VTPDLSDRRGNVRAVTEPGDVPPEILARLRPICLGLPETYEEAAWVGIRWRIRQRTFAHVVTVDPDCAVSSAAPLGVGENAVCTMTFRAPGDELDALVTGGYPFYRPGWGADVVGMVLDDAVDWVEVGELLTESYRRLAPKRLAARVDRPPAAPAPAPS